MASEKKISELPAAVGVEDADVVPIVRGATTYKQTMSGVKGYVLSSVDPYSGSAAKLTTPRNIALTGDGLWSVSFDGSTDVTGTFTLNTVPVAKGGTGAVTPTAARDSLGVRNASVANIEGLIVTWGASSVTVSPGSAYVPSAGKLVESSASIAVALSGLTSGTFYHLYLYDNAGAAAVEISATAPAATATGGYIKTGDNSRRYIASVLASGTTSVHRFVHTPGQIDYNVPSGGVAFNFSGTATVATDVSVTSAVPNTATHALGDLLNSTTTPGATLRIANSDFGTVSPASSRRVMLINSVSTAEILLSSNQSFSYIFDVAPAAPFSLRVLGYKFRR